MVTLHANVVAINLATCIYYARCERFNLPSVHFDALDAAEKHAYTERANELLETLRPAPKTDDSLFQAFAGFTRAYVTGLHGRADKVIGAIAPGERR